MIQLHPDYLLFEKPGGEFIPCSAEILAVELAGESALFLDPVVLKNAAAAVLHYFKHDLGRDQVTVEEFSAALERVLGSFGLQVKPSAPPVLRAPSAFDLGQFASKASDVLELTFFPRLRGELRARLRSAEKVVAFSGLRLCVKRLAGAKRWCPRCQKLNDQIVSYLRDCLTLEENGTECGLVVR